MNYDRMLLKILITDKDKINSCQMLKIINNKYPNIKTYLTNRYCDSESLQESLNRIKYNIDIRPVCKICGKPVKYMYKDKFKQFCSCKCSMNSQQTQNNLKHSLIIKYGVDNAMKSEEIKNKAIFTCLKKYGVKNPNQSKIIRNKIKDTCLKRYGVEHPMQNRNISKKVENKRIMNNSWSSSKEEEILCEYIKQYFPDVITQYNKDIRYPYNCDFYIPLLDYFIELNGMWTHGKHPYNHNSIQDKQKIEKWKLKFNNGEHPMYLAAIENWTIRDVEKRNKAKENNLNFKEVWSLDEGKKFIDELYHAYAESTVATNRYLHLPT